MPLNPGDVVAGRYRIESYLNKGGMGSVYVATDQKFDKRIALKEAVVPGGVYEQFKARFKREAKIGNTETENGPS